MYGKAVFSTPPLFPVGEKSGKQGPKLHLNEIYITFRQVLYVKACFLSVLPKSLPTEMQTLILQIFPLTGNTPIDMSLTLNVNQITYALTYRVLSGLDLHYQESKYFMTDACLSYLISHQKPNELRMWLCLSLILLLGL